MKQSLFEQTFNKHRKLIIEHLNPKTGVNLWTVYWILFKEHGFQNETINDGLSKDEAIKLAADEWMQGSPESAKYAGEWDLVIATNNSEENLLWGSTWDKITGKKIVNKGKMISDKEVDELYRDVENLDNPRDPGDPHDFDQDDHDYPPDRRQPEY